MPDGADLGAEWSAAQRTMTPADRRMLIVFGVLAMDTLLLCGRVRARLDGGLYVPDDDGPPTFVSPILIEYADTPESLRADQAVRFGELVDLVAWDPRHPRSWALRCGAAEWLGAVEPQYLDPPPVSIHTGVLQWLQSGCRGLVLLSGEPVRILAGIGQIAAEDAAHAAELRRIISRPRPLPPVTIARQRETRRAA